MKKSEAIEKLTNFMIENIMDISNYDSEKILDFCVEELGMLPPYTDIHFSGESDGYEWED